MYIQQAEQAYLDFMAAYMNRETEYGWYLCLDGEPEMTRMYIHR